MRIALLCAHRTLSPPFSRRREVAKKCLQIAEDRGGERPVELMGTALTGAVPIVARGFDLRRARNSGVFFAVLRGFARKELDASKGSDRRDPDDFCAPSFHRENGVDDARKQYGLCPTQ
ncbi:MAG TPA: hypothetical protein VE861_09950 [Gemmatimonadaceae bacterium]|nr:hypothetical protein [Gemmatimonadaceae bacterium]